MTNKELDKWLAEKVMGWTAQSHGMLADWFMYHDTNDRVITKCSQWHPTESDSDAMQVVDKMMEKFPDWFFTLDVFGKNYQGDDRVVATFQESAEGYIVYSCVGGKTAPLAISLAAKEAIEEME